jgi:VWFA-related protein
MRKITLLIALVFIGYSTAYAQTKYLPEDTLPPICKPEAIRVNVNQISIHSISEVRGKIAGFPSPVLSFVTVTDEIGHCIFGLADTLKWMGPDDTTNIGIPLREIWQVFEYHKEDTTKPLDKNVYHMTPPLYVTEVRQCPFLGISVAFVMDYSGSMTGSLEEVEKAANYFVDNMQPKDEVAIIKFDDEVEILQEFTGEEDLLREAIVEEFGGGGTALYDAIYSGITEAKYQPGRKAVIVYTDGRNTKGYATPEEIIEYALKSGVPVFTIGIGFGIWEYELMQIANSTGGLYMHIPTVLEIDSLYQVIAELMRNYYVLAHTTTDPWPDTTWRIVDVTVNYQGVTGRGKCMYQAPYFPIYLRGKVTTNDTIYIQRTAYKTTEIPLVPIIFFDKNSGFVKQEFYKHCACEPEPVLSVIADRLKKPENCEIVVTLKGYIDTLSGENNRNLAMQRANNVKDKLLELGVPEEKLEVSTTHDVRTPHIDAPARVFAGMIQEENRRVEFCIEEENRELKDEYEEIIFGPIRVPVTETFTEDVLFDCRLRSSYMFKKWRLEITDKRDGNIIRILTDTALVRGDSLWGLILWNGRDDRNELVELDKQYFYKIVVGGIIGPETATRLDSFYLKRMETIKEDRIFALAEFDTTEPIFDFYWKRLSYVVDTLLAHPDLRVRFEGHTCIIGDSAYNVNLSCLRAYDLHNAFIDTIKNRIPCDIYYDLKDRVDKPKFFGATRPFTVALPCCDKGKLVLGNNHIPQGRNLNRRIEIIIYTKDFISFELDIQEEITKKVQDVISGKYAALPFFMRDTLRPEVSNAIAVVTNHTDYQLIIFYKGPIYEKMDLRAGDTDQIELPPGKYDIVAEVPDPNILPYYGEEKFIAGGIYSARFLVVSFRKGQ